MKINLANLAREFISQDIFDMDTYIDNCLSDNMEYNENIHDCERQQLLCDFELFIKLERYKQLKSQLENLDKEEREILSDTEKDYGTYIETDYDADILKDEENDATTYEDI